MEHATLRGVDNLKGLIPMNLQLHATNEGESNPQGEDTTKTEGQEQETTKTFTEEEFNNRLQSETDKRVSEALKTAKSKWEEDYKTDIEKAKSEAEKLANMNAQEKAEHERDKLQREINELKRKDSLNEMSKVARATLNEAGVPIADELLNVLVTEDAEQTKEAVSGFINVFKNTLDEAITEKLKTRTPKRSQGQSITKEDILNIKDPNERIKAIQENKEIF